MEFADNSVSPDMWRLMRTVARKLVDKGARRVSPRGWRKHLQHILGDASNSTPWRAVVDDSLDGNLYLVRLAGDNSLPRRLLILPAERKICADALVSKAAKAGDAFPIKMPAETSLGPGDVVCDTHKRAATANVFSMIVHWFGDHPLLPGRTYRAVSCTDTQPALIGKLKGLLSENGRLLAAVHLRQGETGIVELELDAPIVFDAVLPESPLSWLLLEDVRTGAPVGVAFIRFALRRAGNIAWQKTEIDAASRARALGQEPFVLWFTGYSGSGKSTVASLLEKRLYELGKHTYLLDGDNIRHGLCRDLGFTDADRVENLRRVAEVARLFVDAGLIVLVSFISPFANERRWARSLFPEGRFVEIFVDTPLEVCEARDVKGLYAKARAGRIRNFTGIDSPYERPENPDIHLLGAEQSREEMVEVILEYLRKKQLV